jgi:hypothetical protein
VKRAVAALAVVAIVASLALVLVGGGGGTPPVRGLDPAGADAFGADGVVAGALRGIHDGAGTRLAVITADGLGVAEGGRIRAVTARGTRVVDAAWFANGSTLLVAEGPVPTGALAVVDLDGTVRGSIPLTPSVGFGDGHGMAIAPGRPVAVVTAAERPTLEAEQLHLVVVALETGETRPLTEAGGPDELGPVFTDAGHVAFTERAADGAVRARLIDLETGAVTDIAEGTSVAGAAGASVVVLRGRDLLRVDAPGRPPVALGRLPAGSGLTSVDAAGGEAVVVETVTGPAGDRTTRLRRVEIDRSPIPG